MILCQNCLREYPDGASYCDNCGEPLVTTGPARRKTARPAPTPPQDGADSVAGPRVTPTPAAPEDLPPASFAPPSAWPPGPAPGAPPITSVRIRLNSGQTFELKGKSAYLIGRRDEASGIYPDLDLTPYGGFEEGVSRSHAVIHVRPDGCFVEDLASTNETLLDFHRLLPRQLYPLKDGAQLRFGSLSALIIIE
jgi:hypothetical protein